jgi:hypothetical protein
MMDKEIYACQFGYLSLHEIMDNRDVLIKANKINAICEPLDGMPEEVGCVVYTSIDEMFYFSETIDQVLQKLENIHPSLR